MKKIIVVFLLFALLFPVVSLADDSDIVGVWVSHELLTTGAPSMSYLYLSDNHVAYYVVQAFHEDSPSLGRQYVGFWDRIKSDEVYIKTGNNTSTVLRLLGDYALDESTLDTYCHVPILNAKDMIRDGLQ